MKINKLKLFFTTVIVVATLFSGKSYSQAFNADEYKIFYNFKTIKQIDNSRLLEVSYIVQNLEDKSIEMPVYNAEIKFYNLLGELEVLLGTAKVDQKGIAKIVLPKDYNYLADNEGYINIVAKFEGSEALAEEIGEVLFKDLFLDLKVEEIDSVKTVSVYAYTVNNGEEVPVETADIIFSVGRMLSKLNIEEGTIEAGVYEFEFTSVIPSDKTGNIDIFATIEESEEFANVIQMKTAAFGTKIDSSKENTNTLWTDAAPIWMYVVLTILLLGVWINFIYTIINLVKIKREGSKPNVEV